MSLLHLFIATGLYLLAVLVLTLRAFISRVSWAPVLAIGIFLTPLAGYIYYSQNKRTPLVKLNRYHCSRCNIDFTDYATHCAFCAKDGITTPLKPRKIYSL